MSKNELVFPKRTIHLDFHTGPDIHDVGVDFNPEDFAKTMKDAHIDSVTLFAMCHHGHLYYETEHPARHPGLSKELNLLEEQIKALKQVGIRVPIYLTVQCNEYAANEYPDWIAIDADGKREKRSTDVRNSAENHQLKAGWQILDMSSPYQDYLADILQEVLDKFAPVDGIFMDMCWDQPSCSKWAMEGMIKNGFNPHDEEDRNKYARFVSHQYMERYRNMVEKAQEGHEPAGIWFNSRPKTNLHSEKKFLRHIEVEALPTGGWGYAYFPYVARFVRPLGLPTLSHTGRFFKSWGDNTSLKPTMALKYECCQILSQGMTNGVGDLLHPRGIANESVYELIGEVFGHVEACEPYLENGVHLSQIGLVVDPELGDRPGPSGVGATRALQQLRQQFDVIAPSADFNAYELLLIPETTCLSADNQKALKRYIATGGKVIFSGPSALSKEGSPLLEEMGIEVFGVSDFTHMPLHPKKQVAAGLKGYNHVMYEQGYKMKAIPSAEVLVGQGEPYFERDVLHFSGHYYTPEDKLSEYAAVVKNGNVITFAVPILEAYGRHAAPYFRQLLGNCINLLMPKPLIRDNGPTGLETTVVKTDKSLVVHLLSFYPERRAEGLDIVEDAIPVVDMKMSVKVGKEPSRVYMAPEETDLDYTYKNGYVTTNVTFITGHSMLVIE